MKQNNTFFKLLRHDFLQGILERWKYFLLVPFLTLIPCFMLGGKHPISSTEW